MATPHPPRQKTLIILLIILGTGLVVFFGLRTLHAYKKFHGHRPPPRKEMETDVELIRDWMTIPYIARMYHVPEKKLFDALDLPYAKNQEKSLENVNKEYFPDRQGYVLEVVKATVLENQPQVVPTSDSATGVPTP